MPEQWVTDILGAPFQSLTLPLPEDDEGPVVATLVRSLPTVVQRIAQPLRDVDVLYVHGWSDYFFQTELARFWNHLGARFYAVDLRKYGRSLRVGQTPGYITSLDDYDPDIQAALEVMGYGQDDDPDRRLVLLGHSTGGLTLTLWAARHSGVAAALVLNSPWLELQLGAIGRQAIAPLVQVRARLDPLGTHPAVDLGFYTRAQTELGSLPAGEHRALWRPDRGFPTHPGWLLAILEGHSRVAAGVEVGCPALVMLSAGWSNPLVWAPEMTSTDSVLVVDDIAKAATRIGARVSVERIEGGIHDLFLSAPGPRAEAYEALQHWLTRGALRER
ncbi:MULTISPECIES: alpha/beta hydrolase [unclassified Microbacterium]|uniref:alpha/beta hydrolase n=1 Tax=unclassified Microbacterium TaxID=2609290 RepID=UPI00214B1EE6|nr:MULTISPECIES: alpha/beta hydrolase [unclassified Microbacterium]MCR2783749.1 alpha/beta hydrolase [Microbacterium sp. zg.B96]MDL5351452.1 alpha/beta hydrolase [Microbacterium sp. zg-YB36]WIM15398.1 alpha/beta hydrolase [Microbacterium sp. zg-B96]